MKNNKKIYVIMYILACILLIGIIPISLFLCNIPDYLTIIFCCLFAVTFILILKNMSKRIKKVLFTAFTITVMCAGLFGNYCNPYWNSISFRNNAIRTSKAIDTELSQKEALKDLDYAMYYLKKLHPACYSGLPDEINQRYEQILNELKSAENITVIELCQKIEYIFSAFHDGHTYVKHLAENTLYVKDLYTHTNNGEIIVAINGIDTSELRKQKQNLYSFEVESYQRVLFSNNITNLSGLTYLGFDADEGITFTYETPDGTKEDVTYFTADFLPYDEYVKYNEIPQNNNEETSFVYYEIDEDKSLAIMTLTSCKYNDEYISCVKEMFEQVKKLNIRNIAVDLRDNGGGSSMVANEFIRYLPVDEWKDSKCKWRFGCLKIPFMNNTIENEKYSDLTFEGEVYILTSSSSFSSAMMFPLYFKDNNMGTIIGEAPGNTPNGYGDVSIFKLPNSQLFMSMSTKEFFRPDQSKTVNLVEPDVPCDSSEVFETLYEQIEK